MVIFGRICFAQLLMIRVAAAEADDSEPDRNTAEALETGIEVKGRMSLSADPPAYDLWSWR
jgi:hypothetical protein